MQEQTAHLQNSDKKQNGIMSYSFTGGSLAVSIFIISAFLILFLICFISFLILISNSKNITTPDIFGQAIYEDITLLNLFGQSIYIHSNPKAIIIVSFIVLILGLSALLFLFCYKYNKFRNTQFLLTNEKICGIGYFPQKKMKMNFEIPLTEIEEISLASHNLIISNQNTLIQIKITPKEFENKLLEQVKIINEQIKARKM